MYFLAFESVNKINMKYKKLFTSKKIEREYIDFTIILKRLYMSLQKYCQ